MAATFTALLDILHVGKAIIQEVSRYNFAVDIGIAEILRSRCMYSTSALVIASTELETEQIMDDVLLAIIEFQKVISDLEERFNNFEENQLHFVCATNGGNGGRGRPRLVIPQEHLERLRSLGFFWTNIAKMLGVSERTIRRRRETFDMPSTGQAFSQIDDDEIDRKIQGILQTSPNSGERMTMGWFRGQGLHVQHGQIRNSMWRVDPIGRELRRRTITKRRVYSVPTPNALW